MKLPLLCGLAMAAILSLAACGGDGDSESRPDLSLDDIRELTGLSAPVEAATTQQQRQQDIVSRADSLIVSTMHMEAVLPDATHTFRLVSECSGPQCELLDPTTGETDTTGPQHVRDRGWRRPGHRLQAWRHSDLRERTPHGSGEDRVRCLDGEQLFRLSLRSREPRANRVQRPVRNRPGRSHRAPTDRERDVARHHGGNAHRRERCGRPARWHSRLELRHGRRRARCCVQRHQEHRPRDGARHGDGHLSPIWRSTRTEHSQPASQARASRAGSTDPITSRRPASSNSPISSVPSAPSGNRRLMEEHPSWRRMD